jgi:L-lysine exporter family protein LysE/ArgO
MAPTRHRRRPAVTAATLPAAHAASQGWLLMAGLIVAIGAQNAHVLRLGLARRHVAAAVALCAASDALLVAVGVFGLGGLIATSAVLLEAVRWAGAVFLLGYAVLALRRAASPQALVAGAGMATVGQGVGSAVLATLAVTWLNPHVYLDTVVLVGMVGAQLPPSERAAFAAGAALASLMWFSALGFGASRAAPLLRRPAAWRLIDAAIALLMAALAVQMLLFPLAASVPANAGVPY